LLLCLGSYIFPVRLTFASIYSFSLSNRTFSRIYNNKEYFSLLLVRSFFFYFLVPEIHIPSRLVVFRVPNPRDQDVV
jgi:hypothetical protein